MIDFCSAVRVGLADFSIWELSNADAIWIENVLLTVSELDCLYAAFFNLLDGSIGEDTLLLSVLKNALDRSVRESTWDSDKFETFTYMISLVLSGKCFSIW